MALKDGMRVGSAALAGVAASVVLAASADAATFTVTKKGDPAPGACTASDCSLREAVRKANNRNGADKIVLPGKGPYVLSQGSIDEDLAREGDLDILNDRVTVTYPGSGSAVVDANEIDRVFDVHAGSGATFKRIIIRDGANQSSEDEGGGIRSAAALKLVRSKVLSSESGEYGGGIGLEDPGPLRLIRSVVAGNEAQSDGAGIDGGSGLISIVNSRIQGNDANGDGALYLYGNTVIKNSTLSGNETGEAGGAIRFSDNESTLRITGSTISGNHSSLRGGGIAAFEGGVRISNSTIAGNTTTGPGGGLNVNSESADVRLNAVTIADNRADTDNVDGDLGGGLWLENGALSVENSLIALNRSTNNQPDDCEDINPVDSQGHNLLSLACNGFDTASDLVVADPRIGELRNNGGPTQTVALRAGSDAIGHAKRSSAPNRDQRGQERDRRPDAGAFER
jgi:hypothetical protein